MPTGYATRSFSSPSQQSEQSARHDHGLPIGTDSGPREHGNATQFNTYGTIRVTPTLAAVRVRKVRKAGDAVISAKCLALWRNRPREREPRGPRLTAHLLARHTYVTC